jgi:CMP-N,N'-diacetyllegionaminic acid synthase
MRTIAIIPARGGSRRLPRKNIFPLNGKPLIAYTIEACTASEFIDAVYVSSDDDEILSVAVQFGALALKRPTPLADDTTPKIVAIRQAVQDELVGPLGKDDVIIIPQANSPQITTEQLEAGIHLMLQHDLWEVMSTNDNGVQNAAFRIVRYHALFNEFLSAHCGFVVANNIDVHSMDDIAALQK